MRQFQKSLALVLQKKGWWGVKPLCDPVTGDIVEARLGSPRRLRVIIPLTMASTNSPKANPDTSEQTRQLTQSEIASLRQDMKESSAWMRQELQGRREQREALPRPA